MKSSPFTAARFRVKYDNLPRYICLYHFEYVLYIDIYYSHALAHTAHTYMHAYIIHLIWLTFDVTANGNLRTWFEQHSWLFLQIRCLHVRCLLCCYFLEHMQHDTLARWVSSTCLQTCLRDCGKPYAVRPNKKNIPSLLVLGNRLYKPFPDWGDLIGFTTVLGCLGVLRFVWDNSFWYLAFRTWSSTSGHKQEKQFPIH